MAQGQIGSGLLQVGIGGVEPRQASGLAQDIGNLFGSVAKGVETYNTIGETAAKLEATDLHHQIVSDIQALKMKELDLAPDDVDSRRQIADEIVGFQGRLSEKLYELSDHKAAYDAFSSSSADTSYVIGQESIGAVNRFNEANNLKLTNTVKSNSRLGLTMSDGIISTNIGILKTAGYTSEQATASAKEWGFNDFYAGFSINVDSLTPSDNASVLGFNQKAGRYEGDPSKVVDIFNNKVLNTAPDTKASWKLDEKGVPHFEVSGSWTLEQKAKMIASMDTLLGQSTAPKDGESMSLVKPKAMIKDAEDTLEKDIISSAHQSKQVISTLNSNVKGSDGWNTLSQKEKDGWDVTVYQAYDKVAYHNAKVEAVDNGYTSSQIAGKSYGYKQVNKLTGEQDAGSLSIPLTIDDVTQVYTAKYHNALSSGSPESALSVDMKAASRGFVIQGSASDKVAKLSKGDLSSVPTSDSEMQMFKQIIPRMVSGGIISDKYGTQVLTAISKFKFGSSQDIVNNNSYLNYALNNASNLVQADKTSSIEFANEINSSPWFRGLTMATTEVEASKSAYAILKGRPLYGTQDEKLKQLYDSMFHVEPTPMWKGKGAIIPIGNIPPEDAVEGMMIFVDKVQQAYNTAPAKRTAHQKSLINKNIVDPDLKNNFSISTSADGQNYNIYFVNGSTRTLYSPISPKVAKTYLDGAINNDINYKRKIHAQKANARKVQSPVAGTDGIQ